MAKGFRGVKDDLSELCRSFLDISCFLGPLISAARPHADTPPVSPRGAAPSPRVLRGVLSDLTEFGGAIRSRISRLSGAARGGQPSGGAPERLSDGEISEGVREFVEDLAKSPESWIEFPVPIDDHDFHLSSPQREHVGKIERLVPNLADLRASICPAYMSEQKFWKLYFILLHSRLNICESELLSTQQIVEEVRLFRRTFEDRVDDGMLHIPHMAAIEKKSSSSEEHPVRAHNIEEPPCSDCQSSTEQTPENPSELDTASRKPLRLEDGGSSLSDTEEDDHVIILRNPAPVSGSTMTSSSDDKWTRLRRRSYLSGDHQAIVSESSEEMFSGDDKSRDWLKVEESDFELL